MEKIELEEARSGADLILDTLLELGISTIFGYPGGAVLPLYDAIYKNEEINHILSRHEQGSLHHAEGNAKSTGKLGVALVTSGPGATNAITGIADAMSDSVPLLVFTGQVATSGIGKDAFQEADIVGITIPITKYNYQIRDTADIPRIIREAVHIATTGRPGPVVIDLPKDVVAKETTFINDPEINLPSYQPTLRPNEMQINKILKQLGKAKKPVIVAGGGVAYSESAKELVAFAERYQIPVVTSLLGQGTIATSHPLFLGMGGMHGSYAANIAMTDADFMIAIGCRFDDRLTGNPKTFAKNAKVVHIDVDPAEIGKIIAVDLPVVGDAKQALEMLLAEPVVKNNTEKWNEKVKKASESAACGAAALQPVAGSGIGRGEPGGRLSVRFCPRPYGLGRKIDARSDHAVLGHDNGQSHEVPELKGLRELCRSGRTALRSMGQSVRALCAACRWNG